MDFIRKLWTFLWVKCYFNFFFSALSCYVLISLPAFSHRLLLCLCLLPVRREWSAQVRRSSSSSHWREEATWQERRRVDPGDITSSTGRLTSRNQPSVMLTTFTPEVRTQYLAPKDFVLDAWFSLAYQNTSFRRKTIKYLGGKRFIELMCKY